MKELALTFILLAPFASIICACIYFLRRNEQIYRMEMRVIAWEHEHRLQAIDAYFQHGEGELPPPRWEVTESLPSEYVMLAQFWRPVTSYLPKEMQ